MQKLPRRFYRAREISEITGLALRTVANRLADGTIPSRKVGDARLIPAEWIEAPDDLRAAEIAEKFALATRKRTYSPRNRYSLWSSPRESRGLFHFLRIPDSHFLRKWKTALEIIVPYRYDERPMNTRQSACSADDFLPPQRAHSPGLRCRIDVPGSRASTRLRRHVSACAFSMASGGAVGAMTTVES
jgi:hypothetical protein